MPGIAPPVKPYGMDAQGLSSLYIVYRIVPDMNHFPGLTAGEVECGLKMIGGGVAGVQSMPKRCGQALPLLRLPN